MAQSQIVPETPANIEAEEAVLGSMLLEASTISVVQPILTADSFHLERHGVIFDAITTLTNQGKPVDIVTLSDALRDCGQLETIGGQAYLAELQEAVPTAIHAEHYATLVSEAALRRAVIALSGDMTRQAFAGKVEPLVLAQQFSEAMRRALPSQSQNILYWQDSFSEWMGWQTQRADEQGKPRLLMPWKALSFVRPLRAGTLAVIGAQSSIGKTLFAECMAEHWAQQGFRVLFCHYELSHQVMMDRRMVRQSGESMDTVESGTLTEAMHEATDRMYHWPGQIHYYACSGIPVASVAAIARNEFRRGRCHIAIVDYLQKAPYRESIKGLNTAQMRGADVETLKQLAEGEGMPVILLSQMNREAAHTSRKTASTLRDSGEIEEKSNLVITLDRQVLDEPLGGHDADEKSPILIVRVDKQTLGKTGKVELWADLPHFRICDLEMRQAAPSWNARQRNSWRG